MSDPVQPATKLSATRAALHAALRLAAQDLGWPAERAHLFPPEQAVSPALWVDVPTVHQAATEAASAVAATFPVVATVNGSQAAQLRQLDDLLAFCWARLSDADAPRKVRPMTAGPEDVNVGGTTVRGLVIRVQVTLLSSTLCQQTLAQ